MCATGTPSFAAASAAASVEFTSPATRTRSGAALERAPLDADEGFRGLLRMRAGADAEEVVGLRQAELVEEDVGHVGVVVLAGMDERRASTPASAARGAPAPPS